MVGKQQQKQQLRQKKQVNDKQMHQKLKFGDIKGETESRIVAA
jgi:hypothetical protein